jgi:hypothetical protein
VGLNGVWALTWAPYLFCPRYGLVSVISIGPGFVAPSYLITLSFTFFLRIFTFFGGDVKMVFHLQHQEMILLKKIPTLKTKAREIIVLISQSSGPV